jgi:hypothetical protein
MYIDFERTSNIIRKIFIKNEKPSYIKDIFNSNYFVDPKHNFLVNIDSN